MHELSLAEEMVERLADAAAEAGARRVVRVVVEIGPYSGVEPDAFEFAFPVAAEGTLCQGAELEINLVPSAVACAGCGATTSPDPLLIRCEQCGSLEVEIIGGREFLIKSADLETR